MEPLRNSMNMASGYRFEDAKRMSGCLTFGEHEAHQIKAQLEEMGIRAVVLPTPNVYFSKRFNLETWDSISKITRSTAQLPGRREDVRALIVPRTEDNTPFLTLTTKREKLIKEERKDPVESAKSKKLRELLNAVNCPKKVKQEPEDHVELNDSSMNVKGDRDPSIEIVYEAPKLRHRPYVRVNYAPVGSRVKKELGKGKRARNEPQRLGID